MVPHFQVELHNWFTFNLESETFFRFENYWGMVPFLFQHSVKLIQNVTSEYFGRYTRQQYMTQESSCYVFLLILKMIGQLLYAHELSLLFKLVQLVYSLQKKLYTYCASVW